MMRDDAKKKRKAGKRKAGNGARSAEDHDSAITSIISITGGGDAASEGSFVVLQFIITKMSAPILNSFQH
jgi:hypothetical protein